MTLKILFVCSGNAGRISPIIENQAESLVKQGVDITYFTVKGKGIKGYLSNVIPFRNYIKKNHFDIIHAHYGGSALIPTVSLTRIPIFVSLMGSDIYDNTQYLWIFRFLIKNYWRVTIVKSVHMKQLLNITSVEVIPNGVNLSLFIPSNQIESKEKVGFDKTKKQIIFVSNPSRKEKNYQLALSAIQKLKNDNIELIPIFNIPNDQLAYYYNAADIILMTSTHEGSPNAIKEAMACNRPIVTTDVGDVKWLLGEIEGCYISSFEPEDVAEKLKLALEFSQKYKKTNGRQKILELGLDSDSIAMRIVCLYNNFLKKL